MGKRTTYEAGREHMQSLRDSKRQRIVDNHEYSSPSVHGIGQEIVTSLNLQNALLFDQSSTSDFRSGLSLFKQFLDSILYSTEEHHLPHKRAILREYLDTQTARRTDGQNGYFMQNLTQAWDYAAETNCEPILSQVTAVLALLFKVLATHDSFLGYGTLLAKTILQPAVARRFVRNTSAASNKENIIAPALRLLTELTKFNHGAHARAVYVNREFTLEPKILERNFLLGKEQTLADQVKRPSIRTTAIRYILTHLRFQDERAKSDILSQANLIRAIFSHLRADPPFLIYDIFDVFKCHVFLDKAIARHVKGRILGGKTLSRIASLYNYDGEHGSLPEGQPAPAKVAHDFLRLVCTDPVYGVMLPANGLYRSAFDDDEGTLEEAADAANEMALESAKTVKKSSKIRNVILSEFIQMQRPYANILQQELIIDIFKVCPELVGDYFMNRRDFSHDPKLTATWIGYSAFLFQTIQLPIPHRFGAKKTRHFPPSIPAMVQTILPQPLHQQILTKCLNHRSSLIQLFGIRLLTAALQKLHKIVLELTNTSSTKTSEHWNEAAKQVVVEVSRLCPPIRTLFVALRKLELEDVKRVSITNLLRLYYEVTPQLALKEKFDVSLPLCKALVQVEKSTTSLENHILRVMELEHWIRMARSSPAMKWWQKSKTVPHSPFVMLLKLLVGSKENKLYAGIRSLLIAILTDQDILQMKTSPSSLDALVASLRASPRFEESKIVVLEFLDDCCTRFTKAPIKYMDDLSSMCALRSPANKQLGPLSPLLMTLSEQWTFKRVESAENNALDILAQWLSRFLYLLKLIGEDETILGLIRDAFVESADSSCKDVLQDAFLWKMSKERAKDALKLATGVGFSISDSSPISAMPSHEVMQSIKATSAFDLEIPPAEDEKHAGLTKWRQKELREAIDSGDIEELLLCLCSKHAEIRLQAINNIRQLMTGIGTHGPAGVVKADEVKLGSTNIIRPDMQQIYLLLGEILESVNPAGSEAFPYVGGVLAARCIAILADPTTPLYSTVNRFLTVSPNWNVGSLPRYFWNRIVASDSDNDGNYHRQVDWYLDYLFDALRTPADMEIFRKSNIFEQLLSYYNSRSCSVAVKDKIVRVSMRAIAVGAGTTLITRCGLMAWILMLINSHDPRHHVLGTLALRACKTCDQKKIQAWSGGALDEAMASLSTHGFE